MKYSARRCRTDRRNIRTHLHDRELSSKSANSGPELLNFVDDVTSVSTFDNNPIFTGGSLRSTFMVVFSHDGSLVASSHGNHKVKVCQLSPLRCIQTLSGHPRSVWSLSFHPSSNDLLASGCLGGQVRVWDLQGRSEVWNCERGTTISSLSFHPHERILAIATANQIHLWDWSHPTPFTSVDAPAVEEYVRLIRFDRNGHHLLTGISNAGAWDAWYDGLHQYPGSRPTIPAAWRDSDDEEVPREPDTMPDPSIPDPPPDGASANQHRGHTGTGDTLSNGRPGQSGGHSMLSAWSSGLLSSNSQEGHAAEDSVPTSEGSSSTGNDDRGAQSHPDSSSLASNSAIGGNPSGAEYDHVTGHMGDHTPLDDQSPSLISRMAPRLHPLRSILGLPPASRSIPAGGLSHQEHPASSVLAQNITAQNRREGVNPPTGIPRDQSSPGSRQVTVSEDTAGSREAPGTPSQVAGDGNVTEGSTVDGTAWEQREGHNERTGSHQDQSRPGSGDGVAFEDPPGVRGTAGAPSQGNGTEGSTAGANSPEIGPRQDHSAIPPGAGSDAQSAANAAGLMTSSHSGGPILERRTPNRVVRVRRRYDGPELVQFRVVSEEFSGPEGRPPRRLTAEELSQAVIIRTEQTFHIPDIPEGQGGPSGESPVASAARALLFDSDNSSDGIADPTEQPPAPPGGQAPTEDRSPFTGLPIGSSLLDHVPNRSDRVEQQVSYPVSRGDGMVGHVTITRSTPADSSILRALQLQRSPGTATGSVNRRTHGARRALPTQLATGASGRRGSRLVQSPRDIEGGSTTPESTRRSRFSRFGVARTAMRRRSGRRRRHATQPEEEDPSHHLPQGEYRNFINQALAHAFQGRWSNPAVANNINDVTHRLQWWDFRDRTLPDISNARANVLVPCCKLYSDASCDISPDGRFAVTFVPNFPDQFVVAAHSLERHNFGSVLFSKKCGAEAITLSISPSSSLLLVGLATSHFRCPAMPTPLAKICKLSNPTGKEGSMELQQVVNHPKAEQHSQPAGLNIARWIPTVGAGFVYGTVKGDLRLCKPRFDITRTKQSISGGSTNRGPGGRHGHYSPWQSNIPDPQQRPCRGQATQSRRRTHTAGTQTDLTSRFVRRRLNPPTNAPSNSFSSRLAVNMADAFNNWSPVNQPTTGGGQSGSSDSTSAVNYQTRSSTPTSDIASASQGLGATDHGLSIPTSATIADQAGVSDATIQGVDTSEEPGLQGPDNRVQTGPSGPTSTTIDQGETSNSSPNHVRGMQDDDPARMNSLDENDPEAMETTSSPSFGHLAGNSLLDGQPGGSRSSQQNLDSSQEDQGLVGMEYGHAGGSHVDSSGSSARGGSSSRSSQVNLNGSMVSLSSISNNEVVVGPSTADSSERTVTANNQNGEDPFPDT